ncbi:hypothetical protein K523DRAFT_71410 [Schizophyllum commune Tattone D]|nr:hypothetical protein K523DRAFT_71410 [Schizophyllum commune Tattone D]
MMSDPSYSPLLGKTDLAMDDYAPETDHRKRRRNRTTQSCLNCHTSKRKCDRKRPCQRCIQLGLTGLCVYEVDDPALRDDPNIDETTRLRNRIAELESLVRELRGKPQPRWADSSFRNGDPNEKWHSRAAKCSPLQARRRLASPHPANGTDGIVPTTRSSVSSLLSPIKTEAASEARSLYRFSPSPTLPTVHFPYGSSEHRSTYSSASPTIPFHSTHATNGYSSEANQREDSGLPYPLTTDGDSRYISSGSGGNGPACCSCRQTPAIMNGYLSLARQLQNTVNGVRHYVSHSDSQCQVYRRIVELNNVMQLTVGTSGIDGSSSSPYGSSTPTDPEVMTPLSASSSYHGHNSSPAVSPQEWNALATTAYNPYFSNDSHSVYGSGHVMT